MALRAFCDIILVTVVVIVIVVNREDHVEDRDEKGEGDLNGKRTKMRKKEMLSSYRNDLKKKKEIKKERKEKQKGKNDIRIRSKLYFQDYS